MTSAAGPPSPDGGHAWPPGAMDRRPPDMAYMDTHVYRIMSY